MPFGGLGIVAGGLASGISAAQQMKQNQRQQIMFGNALAGRPLNTGLDQLDGTDTSQATNPGWFARTFLGAQPRPGYTMAPQTYAGSVPAPTYGMASPAGGYGGFGFMGGQQQQTPQVPGLSFPTTQGLYGGM